METLFLPYFLWSESPVQLRDLTLMGDSLKENGKFSRKPIVDDLVSLDECEGYWSLCPTLANI